MCSLLMLTTEATAQTGSQRYAEHSVLSAGRWVKIRCNAGAGVYQLSNSDLKRMGFSNPSKVRLYGLNLEVLPETAIEDIDDDLVELPLYRMADRLLFYGRGATRWTLTSATNASATFTHFNNPYSLDVCYFLTDSGEGEPREFDTYAYTVDQNSRSQDITPDHVLIEHDAFSFIHSGRTFFDDYDYANGRTQNYDLTLPGLVSDGTNINIAVQFGAAGNQTSSLVIKLNDDEVGTLSFNSLSDYVYGDVRSRSIILNAPPTPDNKVTLTHDRVSGTAGHLDYIRASYLRRLDMSGADQMIFRPTARGDVQFVMSGGSSETLFWHINGTSGIEQLDARYDGQSGKWTIPFSTDVSTTTSWRNDELLALNPNANFPHPQSLGQIANQDLHSLAATDLVIVVPSNGKLTAQARRLAQLHTDKEGMRCAVIPAGLIYNEFSGGTPDATAIRRLMKMLYDRAATADDQPKNILLFGDCLWDNRFVTVSARGRNADDYLLTYQSDNSVHHEYSYVLEDYYTLVDDKTSGDPLRWRPRLGVGRIPVMTNAQAKQVVDKLETYINNTQVGNWKNTICLMADDGNNNQHMQDADSVYKDVTGVAPDLRIRRIYWDTYQLEISSTGATYPDATTDINRQMQEGALVMNYTGHGAAYCLSHEMVMRTSDFAGWNSPRLPLWVTAACDVAPFDMDEENIGETALLNPRGAAMGLLTTARTVIADANRELNRRFMRLALSPDANGHTRTLGQALAETKCLLLDRNSNSTNKAHFILLGDPAMHLALPTYKVVIDAINETYAPGTPYSAEAGSLLTVEGHINDTEGQLADTFDGMIYPLVQDNLETVVCNKNASDTDKAYTYNDRLRTLYTCADEVVGGKFKFTFPIPLDNNYSGQSGLISLYAASSDASIEANGRFTNFIVNGTSSNLPDDHEGPTVQLRLNTEDFTEGDVVNETPLLIADLYDESGINMTGSGIGHDITAVIDNKESWTYSLNTYFEPTVGDYRRGTLRFSIPTLDDGAHTLTLRAYDILNNPSATNINFFVNKGLAPHVYDLLIGVPTADGSISFTLVTDRPQTDISVGMRLFDITGRQMWQGSESGFSIDNAYTFTWNMNAADSHLTPGIYILRADVSSGGGDSRRIAKKFIVPAL